MSVNHDALTRARSILGETSRRNAAACADPAEARHHLSVAAAVDPADYIVTIDLSDGRRFPVMYRGEACLADAIVRAVQSYVPADATELIVSIAGMRTESLPAEACLA